MIIITILTLMATIEFGINLWHCTNITTGIINFIFFFIFGLVFVALIKGAINYAINEHREDEEND